MSFLLTIILKIMEHILKRKIKNISNFELINLNTQSGQTGAFKKAFQECDSEYIIRMDSDLQDD